jgi:tetratricopeptide (TPR) repeat protein
MYWWSNIAVSASPDMRVIAPTRTAYTYDYWGPVKAVDVPHDGKLDLTYPTNIPYGADYFFRIPDGSRPWITALDRDGRGLIQTSTARQVGRKLFAWGSQSGGDRWQDFLSTPGQRFFEIQAGLSRTQAECSPMPPHAEWEWLEAYGLMEAEAGVIHGGDWRAAVEEVDGQLERLLTRASLEERLRESSELASRPPDRILHRGSGWGALERLRREQAGERPFCSAALVFDDESLNGDQTPWLSLLHRGVLPEGDPRDDPGGWMVQEQWCTLLEDSLQAPGGDHWNAHLHLGLMHYARGDSNNARVAWEESLRRRPSGWAYRNLAVLDRLAGRQAAALRHYAAAIKLLPHERHLLVEHCEYLLDVGMAAVALELIDNSAPELRGHSRVQLLEARAGLALRMPERWQAVLSDGYELVDIREGESCLTDFWSDLAQAGVNHGSPSLELSSGSWRVHPALPRRLDFQVAPSPHFKLTGDTIASENAALAKPDGDGFSRF